MPTLDEKVDQLTLDVSEIKGALKGYNGKPGLCEDFEDVKKDYYKFKRTVLLTAAFLVGVGALSTGIWGLVTKVGG